MSEDESDSREEQEEEEEPSLEPDSESEAEQPSDSDSELESKAGSSLGKVLSRPRCSMGGSTASSQSGAMVVRGAGAASDTLMASTSSVEVKEEEPQSKEELDRPALEVGRCLYVLPTSSMSLSPDSPHWARLLPWGSGGALVSFIMKAVIVQVILVICKQIMDPNNNTEYNNNNIFVVSTKAVQIHQIHQITITKLLFVVC